jgi:hypothetical protein
MDWCKVSAFFMVFSVGELVALLVFYFIRNHFDPAAKNRNISIIKGFFERFALLLGLVAQLPTIIIFFGAIKLGTRFKESQESKISNDYFLIGNIASITIAISEYLVYNHL